MSPCLDCLQLGLSLRSLQVKQRETARRHEVAVRQRNVFGDDYERLSAADMLTELHQHLAD